MKLMIGLLVAAGLAFAVLLGMFLSGMDRFGDEARPAAPVAQGAPKVFSGVRGHAEPTAFQPQEAPASRLRPGMKPVNPEGAAMRRAMLEQRRREQLERERLEAAKAEEEEEALPAVEEGAELLPEEGSVEELPVTDDTIIEEPLLEGEAGEEILIDELPLEDGVLPEELPLEEPVFEEGEIPVEEVPAEDLPLEETP